MSTERPAPKRPGGRADFLGLVFDQLQAPDVLDWLADRDPSRFAYVVTPNVDHVVRLHDKGRHGNGLGASLWTAYERAALCLCDSRILRRLAKSNGVDIPVVTGSDLTRRLFEEVIRPGDRVGVVGGSEALMRRLSVRWPGVDFVQHVAPAGMLGDDEAMEAAARFVAHTPARFHFLAVGSPQQELIAARAAGEGGATGTALCVGAGLEFLVGLQTRAPALMQALHIEWLHRLLSNPARMWRRYLVECPRIFRLAARWSAAQRA